MNHTTDLKPIYTEPENCQDCYKCVRECPVKAIQVEDNKAYIIEERCVYCGHCTQVCPTGAKKIRDGISRTKLLLGKQEKSCGAVLFKDGKEIILTAMEYRLLLILLNNRGHILSRTALLENIWDVAGDFVNDNTLTVYIKRLRDKIEDEPENPSIIRTVRGMGYVIEND